MVNSDEWDEMREQLAEVAADIVEQQDELNTRLQQRADLVVEAVDAGMSYREIGAELDISHVAVQKILDDERPYREKRRFTSALDKMGDADEKRDVLNEMIRHFNAAVPEAERLNLLA